MRRRHRRATSYRHQRGVGLVEVLIAILVLGIGILGIAAMQATALRNSQSSLERSQAVIQTYSILDAMRANRTNALAGAYDIAIDSPCSMPSGALAKDDVTSWRTSLQGALGPSACGSVVRVGTAGLVVVTVQWDDTRASGGLTTQNLVTRTQL